MWDNIANVKIAFMTGKYWCSLFWGSSSYSKIASIGLPLKLIRYDLNQEQAVFEPYGCNLCKHNSKIKEGQGTNHKL